MTSNIPHVLETLQQIDMEWSSVDMYPYNELKYLKREFKFLDNILNSYIDEPNVDVIENVQVLFQCAAADVLQINPKKVRSEYCYYLDCIYRLRDKIQETKLKIRGEYSIPKISFQTLAKKDGIAVPELVMEFIDIVTENLSDLLTFNDPSSLLYVGGLMGQTEKALKELKVLRSFVYFISCRCIEPQGQQTFLRSFVSFVSGGCIEPQAQQTFFRSFVSFVSCRCIEPRGQQTFFYHALEMAWHMIMVIWLYFPSHKYDSAPNEEYPLFSDVLRSKIQPIEPSICKIYIDVLQDIKLVESQWYPVIQIIDCEVGFVETLLINLEEQPISSNCAAIKATLKEMLNILRTNLINLPRQALEFHLRNVDSIIVDAGLLVYSLIGNKHEKEVTALGETNQALIQSMKEIIYLITRESFHLRPNLPRNDGLGSIGLILDNLQEVIGHHLNSASSIECQKFRQCRMKSSAYRKF